MKDKECNWCYKQKKADDMYHLGKYKGKSLIEKDGDLFIVESNDNTDYWICNKCNLKEDVV
jgi:hypothetical protein